MDKLDKFLILDLRFLIWRDRNERPRSNQGTKIDWPQKDAKITEPRRTGLGVVATLSAPRESDSLRKLFMMSLLHFANDTASQVIDYSQLAKVSRQIAQFLAPFLSHKDLVSRRLGMKQGLIEFG
jgi:hypothetical protein